MSAERITLIPSALADGPRPTEREIYVKAPPTPGNGRPHDFLAGGNQHG